MSGMNLGDFQEINDIQLISALSEPILITKFQDIFDNTIFTNFDSTKAREQTPMLTPDWSHT